MICLVCREPFDPTKAPGAVLLSPAEPLIEGGAGRCTKYHTCAPCWWAVVYPFIAEKHAAAKVDTSP